jgi:hypothetical protein
MKTECKHLVCIFALLSSAARHPTPPLGAPSRGAEGLVPSKAGLGMQKNNIISIYRAFYPTAADQISAAQPGVAAGSKPCVVP